MNIHSTPMDMSPTLAKQLFAEGAALIIIGVPVGTEFGIDLCSYKIGENFRGVKMIPPGPHYVFCASQGLYGDSAPRVGFVHYFKGNEVIVREWDKSTEELRERIVSNPELEKKRIRENLMDLDKFLAPYDYRYVGEWKHLTDMVTELDVEKCRPTLGIIRTNIELQSCPDTERPRGMPETSQPAKAAKLTTDDNDLLPDLKPIVGTAPHFTKLPDRVPKNAKPQEISKHCIDCLEAIELLMGQFKKSDNLIAEIQLAFIFFLVGFSLESLTHWRKLLNLLANSEASVSKFKLFFMKYSELLAYQLPRLPEELMEPTERNTVYKDVRCLLVNLTVGGLSVSSERLSKKLLNCLKWKFMGLLDDDPEEMPTVVET